VIRLALRQFRAEALVAFAVLVTLAVVLAVTGAHLLSVSDAFKSTCSAARDCATALNPVVGVDAPLQNALEFIGIIAPALVGLFFGAPLIARELETGTFRLGWTQSVTRRRWLAVKLGVVGLAAMAFGGLLTWMANWWASPLDAVNQNRFDRAQFGYHGVAPIGYAAFAFALGVTAGVLLRRTVPAMAATLAGFAAARLAITEWVRPNFASPARESLPIPVGSVGAGFGFVGGPANVSFEAPRVTVPNGWVYSTEVVDKTGHAPTSQFLVHACPVLGQTATPPPAGAKTSAGGMEAAQVVSCVHKLSATVHTLVTYQPGSRFWPFQWAEMGVFLAAALALCGLTYWWLRRQYS
jgi:ABC-2 family transporter protein